MCKGQMKSLILALSLGTNLSRIQEKLKMTLKFSFIFVTDCIIMSLN